MQNRYGRPSRKAPEPVSGLRYPVLHIRPDATAADPSSAPEGPSMDARLAAAGLEADTCGDIYRGLARLCNEASDIARMVVVCVDGLSPAEFEFFTILSRVRRNASVYVYSRRGSASQAARAIERGAVGEATEGVLRMLAAAIKASSAARRPSDRPKQAQTAEVPGRRAETLVQRIPPKLEDAETTPHADADDTARAAPLASDLTAAEPADSEDGPEEADSARPARVPWLRYADEPVRGAPTRKRPSPSSPRAAPSSPLSTDDDWAEANEPAPKSASLEPLLTDEELEALMSDDIAAIAPDEPRKPPEGDEQDPITRGES